MRRRGGRGVTKGWKNASGDGGSSEWGGGLWVDEGSRIRICGTMPIYRTRRRMGGSAVIIDEQIFENNEVFSCPPPPRARP